LRREAASVIKTAVSLPRTRGERRSGAGPRIGLPCRPTRSHVVRRASQNAVVRLVRRSHGLDAALLVHLGEIEERKLYLDWSFSSMFAYCVEELGFSEDVACNRINVARAARRMPIILEVLRSGKVHLAGLRLLAPHLTIENQEKVLA